jgi:tRNA (guanine37-N1)-methyltransferase
MKISIITLFPEMFPNVLNTSIIGRAQKKGLLALEYINLRDFGEGKHKIVDGRPYGGGVGLVFKADILAKALRSISKTKQTRIVLMSASGKPFSQNEAKKLSHLDQIIFVCGHYEGVDQRFIDKYVDSEISIGDYVLTGGELPAMVVIDSLARLIPGVLEKEEAVLKESFEDNLLEHPHFTRPEVFEGEKVPAVLLSGNHQEVDKWRKEQSLLKTKRIRKDLLKD